MTVHSTHKTRISDSSSYDEICDYCGANDGYSSPAKLSEPCPGFAKGFVERQLKDAHKAVAEWPAWMRREAKIK